MLASLLQSGHGLRWGDFFTRSAKCPVTTVTLLTLTESGTDLNFPRSSGKLHLSRFKFDMYLMSDRHTLKYITFRLSSTTELNLAIAVHYLYNGHNDNDARYCCCLSWLGYTSHIKKIPPAPPWSEGTPTYRGMSKKFLPHEINFDKRSVRM